MKKFIISLIFLSHLLSINAMEDPSLGSTSTPISEGLSDLLSNRGSDQQASALLILGLKKNKGLLSQTKQWISQLSISSELRKTVIKELKLALKRQFIVPFESSDEQTICLPQSVIQHSSVLSNLISNTQLDTEQLIGINIESQSLALLSQLGTRFVFSNSSATDIKNYLLRKYSNNLIELESLRRAADYLKIPILNKICKEILFEYTGYCSTRGIINKYMIPYLILNNVESMSVADIAISPCGQYFAIGLNGCGKNIKIFELNSGKLVAIFESPNVVFSVAFSPCGNYIVSGLRDAINVWDIGSQKCIATLEGHSSFVNSISFSKDGQYCVTGSSDTTIKIWDMNSESCIATLEGHTHMINSVIVSPNGDYIASGSSDHTVRIWNVQTGKCVNTFNGHSELIHQVVFSPDGNYIAAGSRDGTITIWDIQSSNCVTTLKNPTKEDSHICSLAYSPDGSQLMAGSFGTINVWNVQSGFLITSFQSFNDFVNSVIFSPDGKHCIAADYKTVKIYNILNKPIKENILQLISYIYDGYKKNRPNDLSAYPKLKELYNQCSSGFRADMNPYVDLNSYSKRKKLASLGGMLLGASAGCMFLKTFLSQNNTAWRLPLLGLGAVVGGIAGYNLGSYLNKLHYILRHEQ